MDNKARKFAKLSDFHLYMAQSQRKDEIEIYFWPKRNSKIQCIFHRIMFYISIDPYMQDELNLVAETNACTLVGVLIMNVQEYLLIGFQMYCVYLHPL